MINEISGRYFWISIVLLAAGTLMIRSSIIMVSHRITITQRHREIFSFIPAAVFPALVIPMVFFHKGQVEWLFHKERAAILLVTAIISLRFKSIIVSVAFGLGALYLVTHWS